MKYQKTGIEFFLQPCLKAAKQLIGKKLIRIKGKKVYSGIIVETEAYLGSKDAASHSYRGMTERNKFMFSKGGIAYVYFTYGNHYCVNAVIGKEGLAHAVLIRAVEPVEGIKEMMKNRGTDNIFNLCSGPGKLTEAMEIDLGLNGEPLTGSRLFIAENNDRKKYKVKSTVRIGITKNAEALYRYIAADNPFVSRVNYKKMLKENNNKY